MLRALPILILLAACDGGREAVAVELPVAADSGRVATIETSLGYTATITAARAAVRDLEFTVAGEEHEIGTLARVWSWLVPSAHAHPGHAADGEITGELRGDFVVDFVGGGELGAATLLTGQYEGLNFTFRRAGEADGLAADDPLVGHTFHVEAEVARDAQTWQVSIALDLDDGTRLIGAPFEHLITETSTAAIGLQLATQDPFEGDTLLDDIEFAALDDDGDGAIAIAPGQAAHNQLRRLFGAHDYYFALTE